MPKYVNDVWGEDKYYYIAHNGIGGYTIKEFVNRCLKTELRISYDEKTAFEQKLKQNGWKEYANNR
jgi:hypothetical protein